MPPAPTLAAALLLLAAASSASADSLGAERRQYVITTDARLDYQRTTTTDPETDADATRTDYALRIAGDYTVYPRVSVGGLVGFEGFITDETSSKSFLFGARLGYLVPLGCYTTWWPRAGLTFANTSFLDDRDQAVTVRTFRLSVSAPFVFQPYPQVLVGLGPTYDRDLTAKAGPDEEGPKTQGMGIHLLFGLWFY